MTLACPLEWRPSFRSAQGIQAAVPDRPEPILALLPQLRGLPGDDLPWLEDAIVANLTQAAAQRPPVVALTAPADGHRTHAE